MTMRDNQAFCLEQLESICECLEEALRGMTKVGISTYHARAALSTVQHRMQFAQMTEDHQRQKESE